MKNPLNKHVDDGHARVSKAINSKMLDAFRRDAGKAVIALRETSAGGDIKLLASTAHAMKPALAYIGETDMSEAAFALEDAGRKGNTEFISANAENFIASLEALIKRLAPADSALAESAGDNDRSEDTACLTEQLLKIKAACEDYDDTTAYAVLDLLKEKPWKKETSVALDEIRDLLFLDSNFEAAVERVDTFLKI